MGQFLSAREQQIPRAKKKATDKFRTMSLGDQLSMVVALTESLEQETLATAIEAIEVRHLIVHEGASPLVRREHFAALFDCVKALVEVKHLKRPDLYIGNAILPA